jgi:L-alanine-DL-glutamate epimerase-like enolase superfamily enzyme
MKIVAVDTFSLILPVNLGGFQAGLHVAAIVGANGLPVVIGQESACTTILSAAEMQLSSCLHNAYPGGEMTGFLRLGAQDVFSPITVSDGKVCLPMSPSPGIEVNREKLERLAGQS